MKFLLNKSFCTNYLTLNICVLTKQLHSKMISWNDGSATTLEKCAG